MSFKDVAGSGLLYAFGVLTVLFIIGQSLFFMRRAWKRGIAIGMPREKMVKAIRSSAIFTIVPTLPIIIALLTMVKGLGIPLPWIKLSEIGSAAYELIAADTAAKSMGLASGIADPHMTANIFSGVVWVMMLGIIWGLVFVIIGLKKLFKGVDKVNTTDRKWGEILINSLFMGMLASFLGSIVTPQLMVFIAKPSALASLIPIAVLLASAGVMGLLTWLAKRRKSLAWIDNYAMALSMVLAMGLAVLLNSMMGGV